MRNKNCKLLTLLVIYYLGFTDKKRVGRLFSACHKLMLTREPAEYSEMIQKESCWAFGQDLQFGRQGFDRLFWRTASQAAFHV